MCDNSNYPDYCSALNSAIATANFTLNNPEVEVPALEVLFLRACYGDSFQDCAYPYPASESEAQQVHLDATTWFGSNPNKPLPPKP